MGNLEAAGTVTALVMARNGKGSENDKDNGIENRLQVVSNLDER